jgi:hypothetical protein
LVGEVGKNLKNFIISSAVDLMTYEIVKRDEKSFSEGVDQPQRHSYQAPGLVCFGAVAELTWAGGSGETENQAGVSPQCAQNLPGPCIIP